MTKKQYFIPQVESLPLVSMTALCVSGGEQITIGGGRPPEDAFPARIVEKEQATTALENTDAAGKYTKIQGQTVR